MASSAREVINLIAKTLRKEVPPAFPVRIKQTVIKDPREFGDCSFSEKAKKPYFLIHLRKGMSPDLVLFVLTHEWAHAVAWSQLHYIDDHGPEWGVAYARCWRVTSGCS
jgi:Zn-dependent peptidase ImmA (M78 family)